uniref:Movement protein n=1 Tax=Chickpea chlorosis Australia virus TaxID=1302848 RepID=H9BAC0_9GEMI|nr:movement protein [Chickpea chlorosis Australia virus]AGT45414.1 movement protein [Chickpea chlorosis Australia virus]AGT45426.1 movement protein [Chickpea chlorosis Australia virus]
MYPAKYVVYPSESNYSYTPVGGDSSDTSSGSSSSENIFSKVVVALVIILFTVGIIYLAYTLFLKDLILLLKAKKQRTTTEIGFGNTPARPNSQRQQDVGPV